MNTSKITLVFLFIVMNYSISNGQYGVRVGANLANLNIKNESLVSTFTTDSENIFCGHIGAFYRQELNEKFSIRPNLLITSGGADLNSLFTSGSTKVSAIYLGLPIDFMFHIPIGENTLSLVGGPFTGYLLSSSKESSGVENEFKTLDYGLNLGFHFQIKSFGIGFSYGIGLVNVALEGELGNRLFGNGNAYTRTSSLFLTYEL